MEIARSSSRRPRIALVEDDDSLALMLCYNIEAIGCSVDWIARGDLALDSLQRSPPDIVILDWMLPGLSGIEILRHLKHDPSTQSLPVLMLTGRTEVECRERARALGADVFLTKPFTVRELMSGLHRLLAKSDEAYEEKLIATGSR